MVLKQKKRITLFCIIALLISAALSLTAVADQTTVKIFGIIIDNDLNLNPGEKTELKADFKVEIEELSITTYTDSNGLFELKDIPVSDEPYSMKISKEGYLQRTVQIIGLNSQTTSINVLINMWLGDIVQDNGINMSDFIELAKCFNSSKGDNNYRDNCDLNKDNVINVLDIMAIAKHFNMEYPPASFSPVTNVISVELVKQSLVEVSFNNAVTADNVKNINFYWNTDGVEGNDKYCADSIKPVTVIDEKTLMVNFSANNIGADITYFFVSGMKDYYENLIPTKKFLISNIPDTPAELIDAQADGDAAIKMSFAKPLNPDSVNTANIKMKGPSGEDVTIRSTVLDNTKKIVTLYFETQPGGNYTISLSNLCADTGIKIPTQNVIVSIIDTTPINSVSVFPVNSGKDDNNKFLPDYAIIKFPEAMLTAGAFSIADKSKYYIAVSGNSASVTYSALNEKDTLTVIDDRTVKITFSEDKFLEGDFNNSTLYMKVALVADKAGNINPVPIYNTATATELNNYYDITKASVKMIDLRTITISVDRLMI